MITATTKGFLFVKGDRINRTLNDAIELCENSNETITTKELAVILKSIQKRIAREFTTRV